MSKMTKCRYCKVEMPIEKCVFSHKQVTENEEHVYCCQKCADQYSERADDSVQT